MIPNQNDYFTYEQHEVKRHLKSRDTVKRKKQLQKIRDEQVKREEKIKQERIKQRENRKKSKGKGAKIKKRDQKANGKRKSVQ